MMTKDNGNTVAPEGFVFVCSACGKRSRDKFGTQPISSGWDESCMLNAMLCEESALTLDSRGRVLEIKAVVGTESELLRS
jgi:hypothetical protein